MAQTEPDKTTPLRHWIICSLLLTFLSIVWADSLHWINWKRKGQQNVFWELQGQPKPPTLLPQELFLTIPAVLFFQLIFSGVAVWRARRNRIITALILLAIWLVSAVFSFMKFSYEPL